MSVGAPPPRFGAYAERYARHRLTYPSALYDLIEARLAGARDHAVDLGAGTGQVALDLLGRFARVTAVEPDPDMAALMPARDGLEIVPARAEEADFPTASVDAVTAGTAFHWMDADVVCVRARRWLRPGGVFAAFAYDKFAAPEAPAVQALFDSEGALWLAHKHEKLVAFEPYAGRVRATSVFEHVEPIMLTTEWRADPAALAGFLLTTSFGTAHAQSTGDEAEYAADFAERVAEAAGGAPVLVRYPIEGAIAR